VPEELERKLKAEAREKGLKGKRFNAFVYGTLRKTGWVPSTQKPKYRKTHGSAPFTQDEISRGYRKVEMPKEE